MCAANLIHLPFMKVFIFFLLFVCVCVCLCYCFDLFSFFFLFVYCSGLMARYRICECFFVFLAHFFSSLWKWLAFTNFEKLNLSLSVSNVIRFNEQWAESTHTKSISMEILMNFFQMTLHATRWVATKIKTVFCVISLKEGKDFEYA